MAANMFEHRITSLPPQLSRQVGMSSMPQTQCAAATNNPGGAAIVISRQTQRGYQHSLPVSYSMPLHTQPSGDAYRRPQDLQSGTAARQRPSIPPSLQRSYLSIPPPQAPPPLPPPSSQTLQWGVPPISAASQPQRPMAQPKVPPMTARSSGEAPSPSGIAVALDTIREAIEQQTAALRQHLESTSTLLASVPHAQQRLEEAVHSFKGEVLGALKMQRAAWLRRRRLATMRRRHRPLKEVSATLLGEQQEEHCVTLLGGESDNSLVNAPCSGGPHRARPRTEIIATQCLAAAADGTSDTSETEGAEEDVFFL